MNLNEGIRQASSWINCWPGRFYSTAGTGTGCIYGHITVEMTTINAITD